MQTTRCGLRKGTKYRLIFCVYATYSIVYTLYLNIDDLLLEVEEAGLGVQLNNGKSIAGLLFADDFVGISDSSENLQKLIDVVHKLCNLWRLKANVSKCAVVVFQRVKYLVAGHGVSIPSHKHQVIVI